MRDLIRQGWKTLRDDFADDGETPPLDLQTTTVFVVSTVLLTLFYYYGRSNYYRLSVARWFEPKYGELFGEFQPMLPYIYWGTNSLVMRTLIPALIILFVLRQSPRDWGYRVRGILPHMPIYAGLYVFMLPFLYWAAQRASFQESYPFYGAAAEGGATFWWYELFYGLQFVGVEAFFRGFLTFGLFKRFGYNALLIMAIPYVMIHFNKPIPETLGALIAGFVLGYLALKSKSFVPGIILHFGIAVTMDLFAISGHHGGVGNALRAIF